MVKVKSGQFAGLIGYLFNDNEQICVFESGFWFNLPVSVGYEVA
jgi:hypothetical protein